MSSSPKNEKYLGSTTDTRSGGFWNLAGCEVEMRSATPFPYLLREVSSMMKAGAQQQRHDLQRRCRHPLFHPNCPAEKKTVVGICTGRSVRLPHALAMARLREVHLDLLSFGYSNGKRTMNL
jgi:hypothetical protein